MYKANKELISTNKRNYKKCKANKNMYGLVITGECNENHENHDQGYSNCYGNAS